MPEGPLHVLYADFLRHLPGVRQLSKQAEQRLYTWDEVCVLVPAEEALFVRLSDISRPEAAALGVGTSSLPALPWMLAFAFLSVAVDASRVVLRVTRTLDSAPLALRIKPLCSRQS